MPDKKLTDSEIPNVKELLEYKVKAHCELCDFKNSNCCGVCMYTAIKQFIELFNSLQAENERLKKFKAYFENLCGYDLEILGVTEDGDSKPYDEFYKTALKEMTGVNCETVL